MQTDASFWDSLVFDGIDDDDVEAATAAFGTVDVVAKGSSSRRTPGAKSASTTGAPSPLPFTGPPTSCTPAKPFYVETPVRAAVLLVGSALAIRYLRESGEPVKPPAGGMPQLVTGLRNSTLTLREVAAQLRAWAR